MCLNTINYDLQHINNFLSRQLHLSSVKFQFLSTFKNVVRQNWHQLLKSGVQSYLYEWIDKHQKSLKVEIKVTAKVLIKINAEELLQFFINEFEKIQENLTPILLPDQVERFFYANFSSNPPTGVLDKFHINKKHEDDVIRIFRMFHKSYIKDKSSRTAYTIDLIYNNFHMSKLRKSTETNFNKYV